ncbi:DUF4328 domain-containing protein [Actinopolymorpha sp. B11F2]|uniref:DUF4328 domain-containing protein n=1 Tax=Actinopolymorpha sp. B11F2 TaxID=3160862 RepID=UPI0032E525F9
MNCSNCSSPLPPEALVCPACGTSTLAEPARPVSLESVGTLGVTLQIMLAACLALAVADAVLAAVMAWSFGVDDSLSSDMAAAPVIYTVAAGVVGLGYALAIVTSAVLFIIWMFRARHNAEVLCKARHRRARGWIIAGWIVPIVSLWFPKQLIDDIWLASDPSTPPERATVQGLPRPPLVFAWWVSLLVSTGFDQIAFRIWMDESVDAQKLSTTLGLVSAPLFVLAGILAILVVSRITTFQVQRGSDATDWRTGSPPIAQPTS